MKTEREMAQDILENFKEITGYEPEEAFSEDGRIDEDFIDLTIDDLVEYGCEKFGIDIRNNDTLFELDRIMKHKLF